jgi:hypothetical protein
MNLPEQLAADYTQCCGGEAVAVARSLHNLDGSPGTTWLAVDPENVVFYFRTVDSTFCRKTFKLSAASRMEVRVDGDRAVWRGRFPEAVYELNFPLWDISVLNRIVHLWKPDITDVLGKPPEALTPVVAFCAAMHALLNAGIGADEVELEWMSGHIPDAEAVKHGGAWLSLNGLDPLLTSLAGLLTNQQKECLLANLVSCVMARGELRAEDLDLIERFRAATGVNETKFNQIRDVLAVKNSISVVTTTNDDQLLDLSSTSPTVLFAASLAALSACDDETDASEEAYLNRLIPRPVVVTESRALLGFLKVEGLFELLPKHLDEAQRHCLMTNLIGLAMVDGELRPVEQELIARFQSAMGVSEDDFLSYLDVVLAKNNLSVLTA